MTFKTLDGVCPVVHVGVTKWLGVNVVAFPQFRIPRAMTLDTDDVHHHHPL